MTVTDIMAPEPLYLRTEQFSTDLQASVKNPPTSTSEVHVGTATWHWTTGRYALLGDLTSDHVTLQSAALNHLKTLLDPDANTISVTATVTYPRTDADGNALTSLKFSGSCDVQFFVRQPRNVIETSHYTTTYTGSMFQGAPRYGHRSTYQLQIVDNQPGITGFPFGMPYGHGLPREDFVSETRYIDANFVLLAVPVHDVNMYDPLAPNGLRGPYTWWGHELVGNWPVDGTGVPQSDFTDYNYFVEPWFLDYPDGDNQLLYVFDQAWHCMELTGPYDGPLGNDYIDPQHLPDLNGNNPRASDFLPTVLDTPLNTHHIANHYGYTVRTYTLR